MKTQRLTMAQALVRHLSALKALTTLVDGSTQVQPYCGGVFAIFGHGNVVALGEALHESRDRLKTYRAHNEQGMAHAAIAFAKTRFRQRMMAVSTSVGPGATNLVTAAAVAHVNRLPLLLLPGDVFANRAPDPVLQQVESFQQGDVSANDCFRPVTRYFDRLTRPEHILTALPRAIQVMTDPASCGPVCLALPQDVQAEAFDCPESFLNPEILHFRRPPPEEAELVRAAAVLKASRKPLIVAGGGVLYSQAWDALRAFAEAHGVPVVESHGGKSSLPWDHPLNLGAIGVDGVPQANLIAQEADLVMGVGTRLQDFTTGSHALFANARLLSLNVQAYDAGKWSGTALVADARLGLTRLSQAVGDWRAETSWTERSKDQAQRAVQWVTQLTTAVPQDGVLPYDAEVIGAVRDSLNDIGGDSGSSDIALCAAGTLPAELHKLWRARTPGGYHMEYGFSCMGYEVAGGLGAKMAAPDREVIVMVGDGSYMMLNSELATSVMLGVKIIVVLLDNRGYGCIQRLQTGTGNVGFNNLLDDCIGAGGERSQIDFAMHARSLGADAVHVANVAELKVAMVQARAAKRSQVIVIDTTHTRVSEGGCWWEVGVPEVSTRSEVNASFAGNLQAKSGQRL